MDVHGFIALLTEESLQEIVIFDLTSGEEKYTGTADEIPSEYEYCDICSIDSLISETRTITINIELGE